MLYLFKYFQLSGKLFIVLNYRNPSSKSRLQRNPELPCDSTHKIFIDSYELNHKNIKVS